MFHKEEDLFSYRFSPVLIEHQSCLFGDGDEGDRTSVTPVLHDNCDQHRCRYSLVYTFNDNLKAKVKLFIYKWPAAQPL